MAIGKKGKQKTNKGAAKRLQVTKSGLLKKRTAGRQHILSKKSRKKSVTLAKMGICQQPMPSA